MMVELMMLVVVVASGGVGVGVRDDRVHDPGLGHAAQSTRLRSVFGVWCSMLGVGVGVGVRCP